MKMTLKTQFYRISTMNTDEIRKWSGLSYHETLIRQQYAEQLITISHILDVLGLGSSELGWNEKWAEMTE